MSRNRLTYLPLGGAGEIGMNAYVYGWGAPGEERYIVVDLGVTFPEMETTPGVALIMPDITFLKDNLERVEAVFITHAHEDHVGAVGMLAPELKGVPVYARAFTGQIARLKLEDAGADPLQVQVVEPWPATVQAGPFKVAFLPISHSIPESAGLVIDSPGGRIVHTGDFKLDAEPGVGEPWDEELWRKATSGRVRALVCDSTNVFSTKPGRSEAGLAEPIAKLVAEAPHMVVATTFASRPWPRRPMPPAGRSACWAAPCAG